MFLADRLTRIITGLERIKTAFLIYVGLIPTIIAQIYKKIASIFNAVGGDCKLDGARLNQELSYLQKAFLQFLEK